MDLGLSGKRVLVTGGSRGIGRAIVLAFLAEGACVSTCARGEGGLLDLQRDAAGQGALSIAPVDTLDAASVSTWVASSAERLGGIDMLVSNASMLNTSTGDQFWEDGMRIDLLQHVRLVELALPYLREAGSASITFVNSISNRDVSVPRAFSAYAAFKAALVNYAAQVAYRQARYGVRVNSVSPGPIAVPGGPWGGEGEADTDAYKSYAAKSGFERLGTPEEVARAVVFLAGPSASWISNVNLRVDGGAEKAPNF